MRRLSRWPGCLIATCPARVLAQAAWEYTPYQAIVWLALEPVPQLPPSLVASLGDSVASRSRTTWGGVLHVQVEVPPIALQSFLRSDLDTITADAVAASASREALEADKLYLTAITYRAGTIVVRVRELDCRTFLGAVEHRLRDRNAGAQVAAEFEQTGFVQRLDGFVAAVDFLQRILELRVSWFA